MSKYCSFWTHGTSVHVEYPDRVRSIHRMGSCTRVRQDANTQDPDKSNNWFHFAIPTPTILDDDPVDHTDVYLRAKVNENAKVDVVHVWEGGERLERFDGLGIVNQHFDFERSITTRRGPRGGLVICAYVISLTGRPRPEVLFEGAGARFRC